MADVVSPAHDGIADVEDERHADAASSMAWSEIVPIVHRQMRSIAGPTRDLDDLTQMALEQVVRSAHRFEGRAQWSTFTYRICAHVAMTHWRSWRRWLKRFEFGERDDVAAESPGAADVLEQQRRRARLYAALEKLDPEKRIVLTLADLEELPSSRIAAIVDCPEPTVRSRLREARRQLAMILAREPAFSRHAIRRGE